MPQPTVEHNPAGRAVPSLPARAIKVGAPAAAVLALVAIGSLMLVHMLSPQRVSGSGYAFQVPAGWRWFRPTDDPVRSCGVAQTFRVQRVQGKWKAIDTALHPILPDVNWMPDSIVCGPHQEGSEEFYGIFVYVGISLDMISFKPPPPWATPGYDSKIPFAFPGGTKGQEAECSDVGTFPMFCWHIPGKQQSDSVDRNPPLCGPEDVDPAQLPVNTGVRFNGIGRFVSVSHASRDYLIVLGGYHVPVSGFPELYCSSFYQLLKSWTWES